MSEGNPRHPLPIMETCRQGTDHKRADKLIVKRQQYASLRPSQLCLWSGLEFWAFRGCLQYKHVFTQTAGIWVLEEWGGWKKIRPNLPWPSLVALMALEDFQIQVPLPRTCPAFNLACPMLCGTLAQNRAWVSTSGPILCRWPPFL